MGISTKDQKVDVIMQWTFGDFNSIISETLHNLVHDPTKAYNKFHDFLDGLKIDGDDDCPEYWEEDEEDQFGPDGDTGYK